MHIGWVRFFKEKYHRLLQRGYQLNTLSFEGRVRVQVKEIGESDGIITEVSSIPFPVHSHQIKLAHVKWNIHSFSRSFAIIMHGWRDMMAANIQGCGI